MEPSREKAGAEGKTCDTLEGKTCDTLTVDDVYGMAKALGAELEGLIDSVGAESVSGLVSNIVKVLELLESFVARSTCGSPEDQLLRAYESLQGRQQKKQAVTERDNTCNNNTESRDLEQRLRARSVELQAQVGQLQEENQELLARLKCSHSQEDQVQRQERELMLKLKVVVDRQRDEIRAKVQEVSNMTKEVEALQEQLDRFMKMNADLRHKGNVAQAQVKSAMERKTVLEDELRDKQNEISRLNECLQKASASLAANVASSGKTEIDLKDKMIIDLKDPNRPCFTKQEVRDILFERNELKANLFLVQEELSYFQREILNEERYPALLLDAMRSAIKKQRTVIMAKMLGIPEDKCSSDEDKVSQFEGRVGEAEVDGTSNQTPPVSRIRNLFGFLGRPSSAQQPSQHDTVSAWEIIGSEDIEPSQETRLGQSPVSPPSSS